MHVGIIPDGNRRWALKRGLPVSEGHRIGAKKIEELLNWWKETDIKILTIYLLSYDNFIKRSKDEIMFLLKLLNKYLNKLLKSEIIKEAKIIFAGLINKLPKKIYEKMKRIMELSDGERKLYLLVCYSGKLEIQNAIKKLIKNNLEINDENIRKFLWVKEDVDLIIRTGGWRRLSDFLIYQSSYAELYFLDKLWPDFTKEDFLKALEWYNTIQRNFGK